MATTMPNHTQKIPSTDLKHLVYSKYCDLIGSYNDKACKVLKLPAAYIEHEDKYFTVDKNNNNLKNNK